MEKLPFHPATKHIPLMPERDPDKTWDLERLGQSIKEHGLLEPVKIYQGKILDGRNRYRACQKYCPEKFDYVELSEQELGKYRNTRLYAWSQFVARRHVTAGEAAAVAKKMGIVDDEKRKAKERQREHGGTAPGKKKHSHAPAGKCSGESADQAGAAVGISGDTLRRFEKVEETAEAEVVEAVADGRLPVKTALQVVKLPPAKQREIIKPTIAATNEAAQTAIKDHAKKQREKKEAARPKPKYPMTDLANHACEMWSTALNTFRSDKNNWFAEGWNHKETQNFLGMLESLAESSVEVFKEMRKNAKSKA